MRNASKCIDEGDSEKASEFLWGSMAQALKGFAASRGRHLRNHRQIWDFVEGLAKELEVPFDKSQVEAFDEKDKEAHPDIFWHF